MQSIVDEEVCEWVMGEEFEEVDVEVSYEGDFGPGAF